MVNQMATLTVSLDTGTVTLAVSKTVSSAQLTRLQTAISAALGGNPTNQQLINYIGGLLVAGLINLTYNYERQTADDGITNIAFS